MLHRRGWIAVAVLTLLAGASSVQAQARKPGQPGANGQPGQGAPGQGMMTPEQRQQLLQRFDRNGNGQLDPDEQQAAMQAMQQMRGQGGGQPGTGRGPAGAGGQGGPGAAAALMNNPQMMQQMLQRFDANGNGQLDPDEQQAAMQAMQQMRAQGGQPGPAPARPRNPNNN